MRLFKIVSEAGVAAGVRRIEALTDKGVMKYYAELEKTIEEAAKAAKAEPVQLVKKIAAMNDEIKSLMSENEKLKASLLIMHLEIQQEISRKLTALSISQLRLTVLI
ncbi:MAG: hypothetical protein ACLS9K_13300 [Lachnospira eligens]